MRKPIYIIIALLLVSCAVHRSTKVLATKDHSDNLVGIATKNHFLQAPYKSWFVSNYEEHLPEASSVKELKQLIKGVKIKAFMGTWCGDSKREIPKFYKLLDAINFNYKNLQLVAVNRSKKTPDKLEKGYHIKRVPTFIFYKKGEEIGRFVEYAVENMEKDFIKILKEDTTYKNPYQ